MKVIETGYLIEHEGEYLFPNYGIFTRLHNVKYQCDNKNRIYNTDKFKVVKVAIMEVEDGVTGQPVQSTEQESK